MDINRYIKYIKNCNQITRQSYWLQLQQYFLILSFQNKLKKQPFRQLQKFILVLSYIYYLQQV
ncbi:unnamed protein product [Paramecium sonneborni]|uniref:Uncharacterized protein n=1 Tax=Paramecium sonneborni TaxID=65129 RepID=A0A8S1KHP1_9CILI|nr:unnamed protein product [Paramecium sonneborni]